LNNHKVKDNKDLCLIVGGSDSYFIPPNHLGFTPTEDLDSINIGRVALAIFTGGEDVDPSLYGHTKDRSTGSNIYRDSYEKIAYEKIHAAGIPKLGICRGAQFLCVMAGGSLIQDVTGHGNNHRLKFMDKDGKYKLSPEKVTSTHHQMQYPWELSKDDFNVLAHSPSPISHYYTWNGKTYETFEGHGPPSQFDIEPDVVFYRKINSLAIQYHPEWMEETSWGMKYARDLISKLIRGEL
jgi:gamma-glutamyl-gamma-aminobutyrate hydrolase PuuD